jgi:hypothetical protein
MLYPFLLVQPACQKPPAGLAVPTGGLCPFPMWREPPTEAGGLPSAALGHLPHAVPPHPAPNWFTPQFGSRTASSSTTKMRPPRGRGFCVLCDLCVPLGTNKAVLTGSFATLTASFATLRDCVCVPDGTPPPGRKRERSIPPGAGTITRPADCSLSCRLIEWCCWKRANRCREGWNEELDRLDGALSRSDGGDVGECCYRRDLLWARRLPRVQELPVLRALCEARRHVWCLQAGALAPSEANSDRRIPRKQGVDWQNRTRMTATVDTLLLEHALPILS